MLVEKKSRWDPDVLARVEAAAARAGISFSQYVQSACLFRATFDYVRDPAVAEALGEGYAAADRHIEEAARRMVDAEHPFEP